MRHTCIPRLLVGLLIAAVLPALCAADPAPRRSIPGPRSLSLEDRVAAQRAIEQVHWNHRTWPKENPGPKPALSAVMTDAAIRARVEDSLRKSNALEKFWHRPVSAEQLQAEMNRMAARSRDPQVLQELFASLSNDPFLIAETLARPALVDRLLRDRYANDPRLHGEPRKKAEAALARCQSVECMPAMGGEYHEMTWMLDTSEPGSAARESRSDVIRMEAGDWRARLKELAGALPGVEGSIHTRKLSGLQDSTEGFFVTAVLAQGKTEIRSATVTWPKLPFDEWWRTERPSIAARVDDLSNRFTIPAVDLSGCVADTWASTMSQPSALSSRRSHTAVWTGTEMIVWGGVGAGGYLNTGGRYDPSTDTWTPMATGASVPVGRQNHTAVWTGTEMIVWGGASVGPYTNTGGRYDPATDTWTPTLTVGLFPTARAGHTAVWTGTEMIVWGGLTSDGMTNTGARYHPSTDSWGSTSTSPTAPTARAGHTAVWTGSHMIIWGGTDIGGFLNTGAQYEPAGDTWLPTTIAPSMPVARGDHTAVWTGTEMIVWGGLTGTVSVAFALNSGGRYNPSTGIWVPTSMGTNVPTPTDGHTAVWTGTEMLVWGGGCCSAVGGRYDPATDAWNPISLGLNAPTDRHYYSAIWTGAEMIVWGGFGVLNEYLNTGGRYDPSTDAWAPTGGIEPVARYGHSAVWTGAEMIVWGGWNRNGILLPTGARYDTATDVWTPTPTGGNAPSARARHTAVWTGAEMIVWGGTDENTGGRYAPYVDTWTATSTGANVPSARSGHAAVWTGTEMIVWGGSGPGGTTNTGGRYAPSSDTWASTSTGANTPSAESFRTAVWAGNWMIVWGGGRFEIQCTCTDFFCDFIDCVAPVLVATSSGGRYEPSTDTWTPVSMDGIGEVPRVDHTAVWTGTEMIVWGGFSESCYFLDGAPWFCTGDVVDSGERYDASADTWTPTSIGATTPDARSNHTAVWTGKEMIIWGGFVPNTGGANTGGRYDPSTDIWTSTSTGANVPEGRGNHTAVWTGREMILWGGTASGGAINTGGLYCACPDGALYYRDSDGDGYGDAAINISSCDGTVPAGYVASQSDCDDTTATVSPGAVELCNGVDDNCDGAIDNAVPPGPFGSVTMGSDAQAVEWTALAAAQTYDVVYGNLGVLHSSGGDYTAATLGCLEAGTASTTATFLPTPEVGQAFWILVRGDNCAGVGTYDSGVPSQVGSRDAGIAASPFSCGYQPVCGDGVCNGTEDCSSCASDCGVCPCLSNNDCQPNLCCYPTDCIPIWVPQACPFPICDDQGPGITCVCQNGACVGFF